MIYTWASSSDIGRLRDHNEDAVAPRDMGVETGWFVIGVADGMGGHVGGEIASAIALETALEAEGNAVERVQAANRAVVAAAEADPALQGMGTTLTLGVIGDDAIEIGHIGDSRAYLLRRGELLQLTEDHSLIAEMIANGEIEPDEAAYHPYRSVITRAVGLGDDIEVDRVYRELARGDRLLLCTDGLTNMVADTAIQDLLTRQDHPSGAARALIEAANAAGGADNISAVVVHVTGDTED